jgi:hypothetical protein
MAALTADILPSIVKAVDTATGGYVLTMDVGAGDDIYKGAFVAEAPGGDGIGPALGTSVLPCIGIALQQGLNAGGSAGDLIVDVLAGIFAIEHDVASTTIANLMQAVFCDNDNDLYLTATTSNPFGYILNFISGDNCVVMHDPTGAVVAAQS